MQVKRFLQEQAASAGKKAMPILSFPSTALLGCSVRELIASSDKQAQGMAAVAARCPSLASVSMMDLSVEAEAFGSTMVAFEDEVPAITGILVETPEDAEALAVPEVGAARTGLYVETIRKACELITDRPVFAGVIGPFSLAGRLMGVSEIMLNCYDEEDMVHTVMRKATDFLKKYITAYKEAGAVGVVMAEPLTGIMSPALAEEFSAPYVKEIIEAVQTDEFGVVYHNCGASVEAMLPFLYDQGAVAYHFGDAVDLGSILAKTPEDIVVMGNISPVFEFKDGTPESIRKAVVEQMEALKDFKNYIPSSGCDIPPKASWANIDAYFRAVEEMSK
ncbi:MAG: uroporphyrinogen decarboxylase family protein [Clostridia bacterium]|nr:uroporphyrinogen decarboxylase family protein [Clostridia bacterium]